MKYTSRRLSDRVKQKEISRAGNQSKYQAQEQGGAKKFKKYAIIGTSLVGLVAAGIGIKLGFTEKDKNEVSLKVVEQQQTIADKEKTLEQTANDYIKKAEDFMSKGDIVLAKDFVKKAEDLEPGTQYKTFIKSIDEATDFLSQYNARIHEAKKLLAEQKFDSALAKLNEKNTYDEKTGEATSYGNIALTTKLLELGVEVSDHEGLEKTINKDKVAYEEDRKEAAYAKNLANENRKYRASEMKREATLDNTVDANTSISFRYKPASKVQGASLKISTKKGDKMVQRTDKDRNIYQIAEKLERIIPDGNFSGEHLKGLFQTGNYTGIKISEGDEGYKLIITDKNRKELHYNIDKQYNSQIEKVFGVIGDYKKEAKGAKK